MEYAANCHQLVLIVHVVENSVVPNAKPPTISSAHEFLRASWAGIFLERDYGCIEALNDVAGGRALCESREIPSRRSRDFDPVLPGRHSYSPSSRLS